jgi:hypothetical protein
MEKAPEHLCRVGPISPWLIAISISGRIDPRRFGGMLLIESQLLDHSGHSVSTAIPRFGVMIRRPWRLTDATPLPRLPQMRDSARAGKPARRALVNRAALRRLGPGGLRSLAQRSLMPAPRGIKASRDGLPPESFRQIGVQTFSMSRRADPHGFVAAIRYRVRRSQ